MAQLKHFFKGFFLTLFILYIGGIVITYDFNFLNWILFKDGIGLGLMRLSVLILCFIIGIFFYKEKL